MKTTFKPFRPKAAPSGTVRKPMVRAHGTVHRGSIPTGSLFKNILGIIRKAHVAGKEARATRSFISKFKNIITPGMIKKAHVAGIRAVITPGQKKNTKLHDRLAKQGYWDPL